MQLVFGSKRNRQITALKEHGCEEIFKEKASGKTTRPGDDPARAARLNSGGDFPRERVAHFRQHCVARKFDGRHG
jgi:hypothetical protein